MVVVASILSVLAQVGWPDGLDQDEAETAIIVVLVVIAVAIFFVLRTFQKVATRAIVVLVLLAVAGGLLVQRQNLQDCAGQCECRLFGRTVDVHDPDAFCPD
jgi:hypothetical protein